MLAYHHPEVKSLLFSGNWGIEKESLRIDASANFAHTPHPFPDHTQIVRDFSENQLEVNTGVNPDIPSVMQELTHWEQVVEQRLKESTPREYLWKFSNPPYIKNEEDIPVAQFTGILSDKTKYRNYLSEVYGKYKMTFSGIHVNYSYGEDLIRASYEAIRKDGKSEGRSLDEYRDQCYLNLAANLLNNGWLITLLLSASPLLDASFLNQGEQGTDFLGMASVRCSDLGYWNHFVPILSYESVKEYTDNIRGYIEEGLISSQTELYYPVRLKSKGENSLDEMDKTGVNHIEMRNIDINPYAYVGLDERDLQLIHLLLVYDSVRKAPHLGKEKQIFAIRNFKNAARYDIDQTKLITLEGKILSLREAGIRCLKELQEFLQEVDWVADPSMQEALAYQFKKLTEPDVRYAERVKHDFKDDFVKKGLKFILEK